MLTCDLLWLSFFVKDLLKKIPLNTFTVTEAIIFFLDLLVRNTPVKQEETRNFGDPVGTLAYTQGNVIGPETGPASLLEPTKEFKEFDIAQMKDDGAVEKAFVDRFGPFAIACCNARVNGIMYLGIGDSHSRRHYHGCILGVRLDDERKAHLHEVFNRRFFGKDPGSLQGIDVEVQTALQNCLKPPKFIPVSRGTKTPNLYIIELEVEPASSWCGELRFHLSERKDKPKRRNKGSDRSDMSYAKTFFLREGTETNTYREGEDGPEVDVKVKAAIRRRKYWEENRHKKTGDCPETSSAEKLVNFLCRGRTGGTVKDRFPKCVLLCNGLPKERRGGASWIEDIDWHAIWDFSYEDDGPKIVSPESRNKRIHIKCGEDSSMDLNLDPTQTNILMVIGGDARLLEVSRLVQQMVGKLERHQFLCVYVEKALTKMINQVALEVFGSAWEEQAVPVTWDQLNQFMNDQIMRDPDTESFPGDRILASTGALVSLPPEMKKSYKEHNITVLPSNQCDELLYLSPERRVKFFQGGDGQASDWLSLFHTETGAAAAVQGLPPEPLPRDVTRRIKKDLRQKTFSQSPCTLSRVRHEPGSGATTVGRTVLWKMRGKMRCVLLDGNDFSHQALGSKGKLRNTVKKLLDLRAFGESEEVARGKAELRCPSVLILFDNSDETLALQLKEELEKQMGNRGIRCSGCGRRPLFHTLNLERTFDKGASHEEGVSFMEQSLTRRERDLAAARLNVRRGTGPTTLQDYVDMAGKMREEKQPPADAVLKENALPPPPPPPRQTAIKRGYPQDSSATEPERYQCVFQTSSTKRSLLLLEFEKEEQ